MKVVRDTRKVQTAVFDDRDSDAGASLPVDPWSAERFRDLYEGRTFWCGHLLRGCGQQLSIKIYDDRVAHFAHRPGPRMTSSRACELHDRGIASADHLHIHNGLAGVVQQRSGMPRQRFDGIFNDYSCSELVIRDRHAIIQVQLEPMLSGTWTACDRRLREENERVSWLFGPRASHTAEHVAGLHGYALLVRCDQRQDRRVVQLGTLTADSRVGWSDLYECRITENGIITPEMEAWQASLPEKTQESWPVDFLTAVARPLEPVARPLGGLGIPAGTCGVPVEVIPRQGGDVLQARILVPDRLTFTVGEDHEIVGVSRVKRVDRSERPWDVFADGLRPLGTMSAVPIASAEVERQVNAEQKRARSAAHPAPKRSVPRQVITQGEIWKARDEMYGVLDMIKRAREAEDVAQVVELLHRARPVLKTLAGHDRWDRAQLERAERWVGEKRKHEARQQQEAAKAEESARVGAEYALIREVYRLEEWKVRQQLEQQKEEERRARAEELERARATRRAEEQAWRKEEDEIRRLKLRYAWPSPRAAVLPSQLRDFLQAVAARGETVTWVSVALSVNGAAWLTGDDWVSVLAAMDQDRNRPLLAALITMLDGRMDPGFADVLARHGRPRPDSPSELQIVWQDELKRLYTTYGV
ncbi:hypothetical protein AB0K40_08250 [Nonomuraea bangladeshensis]|uniref:Uncharacterized protein n=1 Tax=Nonomuraea bangladeshensis TaxID=404385 RepID=A0ABV3GYX3_9ACTN